MALLNYLPWCKSFTNAQIFYINCLDLHELIYMHLVLLH